MVHQLNVIQIIKMDTPAVLFMDGVEIQLVIVHVTVALITVKVNFEKKTLSWMGMINPNWTDDQTLEVWDSYYDLPNKTLEASFWLC